MSGMPAWEKYIGLPLLMLHDKIYKGTNGRIGHRILPGTPPNLLLHTVGAKTGIQRTNSLTYAKDGNTYLVVASKGGDPKAPGWYHNLKANPQVEINIGPKRMPATARIIGQHGLGRHAESLWADIDFDLRVGLEVVIPARRLGVAALGRDDQVVVTVTGVAE